MNFTDTDTKQQLIALAHGPHEQHRRREDCKKRVRPTQHADTDLSHLPVEAVALFALRQFCERLEAGTLRPLAWVKNGVTQKGGYVHSQNRHEPREFDSAEQMMTKFSWYWLVGVITPDLIGSFPKGPATVSIDTPEGEEILRNQPPVAPAHFTIDQRAFWSPPEDDGEKRDGASALDESQLRALAIVNVFLSGEPDRVGNEFSGFEVEKRQALWSEVAALLLNLSATQQEELLKLTRECAPLLTGRWNLCHARETLAGHPHLLFLYEKLFHRAVESHHLHALGIAIQCSSQGHRKVCREMIATTVERAGLGQGQHRELLYRVASTRRRLRRRRSDRAAKLSERIYGEARGHLKHHPTLRTLSDWIHRRGKQLTKTGS